jgi:hypothetical protein
MVCGRDDDKNDQAVIVELKQWERCEPAEPAKLLRSWVGGRQRDVLHPSVQVGQYRQYLEDTHTAFHEGPRPIGLSACSYLHNYLIGETDPIRATKFADAIRANPLFDSDGAEALGGYLRERLAQGDGRPVLRRVEDSPYRPSRKLMDYVAATISEQSPWILLDEQLVIFEKIRSTVHSGLFGRRKQVVIVRGGPGTGKSVLAINLMADLLRDGRSAHYATGSKAFTETLWDIVGSRSRVTFKYFNSYARAQPSSSSMIVRLFVQMRSAPQHTFGSMLKPYARRYRNTNWRFSFAALAPMGSSTGSITPLAYAVRQTFSGTARTVSISGFLVHQRRLKQRYVSGREMASLPASPRASAGDGPSRYRTARSWTTW